MTRLLTTALFTGVLWAAAGPAVAAPAERAEHAGHAGHTVTAPAEGADGCDHGATGKPCRQDPQGSRGQDCEDHGRFGGRNEDHCDDSVIIIIVW